MPEDLIVPVVLMGLLRLKFYLFLMGLKLVQLVIPNVMDVMPKLINVLPVKYKLVLIFIPLVMLPNLVNV